MSEHLTEISRPHGFDRIELDAAPFIEDREGAAGELAAFTARINAELGKRGMYLALYDGKEPVEHDHGIRRVFDEEHIDDAVLEAREKRTVITDAAARVIASQLHGGQNSAMYALALSGAIVDGLLEEIDRDTKDRGIDPLARYWAQDPEQYVMVRIQKDEWDAVEGWSGMWLGVES